MDNLSYMIGVITGFVGALVFDILASIYMFLKDRARNLDKKDYKAFNQWKEQQENVKSR